MGDARTILLPLPADLRAEARALLGDRLGEGERLMSGATFVADLPWEEWGEGLAGPFGRVRRGLTVLEAVVSRR